MAYKFIQSPYWQSRQGKKIDGIVIHTTVGTYDGTITYFQNNDRSVSAHYVVSLDGDITQMVNENVGANHAGNVSNPTTPVYKGFNPNWNTIGIENADNADPAGADRSRQLPALANLVRDICLRNGIPIDRNYICGHRELYDKKTCPGNIDVNKVVSLAAAVVPSSDVITDQTKIPQIGNMEVQAIRSKLNDQERDIANLNQTVQNLNFKINDLQKQINNFPTGTKEPVFNSNLAKFLYSLAKSLG
ncbi:MAG TPA: peptidoglycan recognition family protein [Alphaproteobacteria bacterium]|jgi:N-acetylmuramoyl-L-alanine amidase CwlA|nr:peptidoglycan recognition family protein [Alphaproteobacteria bacterium]